MRMGATLTASARTTLDEMGYMGETERAAAYVRANSELRDALGIDADAPLEPIPLGRGEHNNNYVLCDFASGRKFVLRINVLSQPFHQNQVRYEYDALRVLEQSGRTPKALYIDDSKKLIECGVLVISFCEGEMLDFDSLRPGDLNCAAQLMADIHAVPVPSACTLHRPEEPLHELFDECMGRFEYYLKSGFEEPRITRWMQRYIDVARPALDVPCACEDAMHIINTETLASHFLIPQASAQVAARNASNSAGRFCDNPGFFVDWERPIIGEPAQDLAFFVAPTTTYWDSEFMFPRQNIEAFLEDYWCAVDGRFAAGAFEERFWAYLKVSVLRSAMWCCKALARYGAGGTGPTTEKTKSKLPIYLSDEFNERIFEECFSTS